jgi:hypothetical protein
VPDPEITGLPAEGEFHTFPWCGAWYDADLGIACSDSEDQFISTAVCVAFAAPAAIPPPIPFP